MDQVVGLKFAGNCHYDQNANNGIGEYKAYFVLVKEGHENEAQDKMRAFASAGTRSGTRVRDGVISMSRKQIDQRIAQLKQQLSDAGVNYDDYIAQAN